ncbi:hypothetical protein NR798_06055 [Archangium gephyra]|uniref:GumC family protein n=1 Tax=Archangium gephyra TaxID=48 RepID=UPI0035D44945
MFAPGDDEVSSVPGSSSGRADAQARPGHPLEVRRVVRALRHRWRLIALTFLAGIPIGVVIAMTWAPREYTAQAVLVWEPPPTFVSTNPQRDFRTLVDTIKLPTALAEVRQRMGLSLTLESLARRIDADAARDSNILLIQGKAGSAEEAMRLTATLTQVFLDGRTALERARAEERLRALGEEISRVNDALSGARERYDRFRQEHGISDLALDRQAAIEEAALLRAEVHRSHVEMGSEEARGALLRSAAHREHPKVVLSETQSRATEQKLVVLRTELTARRASLSDEHPEVQGLAAAVAALEARRSGAPELIDQTVGTNPHWSFLQQGLVDANVGREAAQKKWQSFSRLEDAARERVARLSALEGQASLLLAEIHLAENRLSGLKAEQREAEATVHQAAAGFRVLDEAALPTLPARSYRRLVAIAFPLLSSLCAALVCAGLALRGLKLWTPAELAFWGGAPAVAASAWPTSAEGLEELALDLGEPLSGASGSTLLLALDPARASRAVELAARLEPGAAVSLRESVPVRDATLVVWDKPGSIQVLRRTVRQSARVLVLVEAGAHSLFELAAVRRVLGGEARIGFVVLGLGTEFADSPDQVGDVPGFWLTPPSKECGS